MKVYVLMEWEGNSAEIDGGTVREAFLDRDQAEAKVKEMIALEPTPRWYGLPLDSKYEVQETELHGVLDWRGNDEDAG